MKEQTKVKTSVDRMRERAKVDPRWDQIRKSYGDNFDVVRPDMPRFEMFNSNHPEDDFDLAMIYGKDALKVDGHQEKNNFGDYWHVSLESGEKLVAMPIDGNFLAARLLNGTLAHVNVPNDYE